MSLGKRSVLSKECAHSCSCWNTSGARFQIEFAIKKYYGCSASVPDGAASVPMIARKRAAIGRALPPSLHDQHRALRELHDAVGAAADHALVQCRMAFRADDEQIDLELGREPNDVAHGMARDDVRVKLDVMLLRHGAGALQDGVEAARGGSRLFPDFFDEGRHVVDLFD